MFTQVEPPGFNLVYLPFADDIRRPERDLAFVGDPPPPVATDQQARSQYIVAHTTWIALFF